MGEREDQGPGIHGDGDHRGGDHRSKAQRIVVIGASAAGLKAAARAKRLQPRAELIVLDERTFISYGACGLPYYLSGDVEELDKLRQTNWQTVRDPDFFSRVKGVDVRTGWRVESIDPGARSLRAVSVDAGKPLDLNFDQLVIATGAAPRSLPGIEVEGAVGFFHTPEDAAPLRKGLERGQIGSAVIVGGGFVGVEVAAAFQELWGCEVTLLEAAEQLLPWFLDVEMSDLVAAQIEEQGVRLHLNTPVTGATSTADGAEVRAGAETFAGDRAIVAVGVSPRVEFARAAGLAVGRTGALVVDDRLRTSAAGIFAAGDCIENSHRLTGQPLLLPLGSLANRQGRVVGDNLSGRDTRFPPVVGSACVKIFDWNVAVCGLTAAAAQRAGLQPRAAWGTFLDVAHYYPEHHQVHLKLIYEEGTQRLLGLQAVGPGEVVKRVDMFASLLQREGELTDLLDLEPCYAPPYNAALDPLHGLGSAALNQEETGIVGISPGADPEGRHVVDVRSADEIAAGRPGPAGTVNIAIEDLRARVREIPADRPLLILCEKGPRSAEAARWLVSRGFTDIVYLAGGAAMRTAR